MLRTRGRVHYIVLITTYLQKLLVLFKVFFKLEALKSTTEGTTDADNSRYNSTNSWEKYIQYSLDPAPEVSLSTCLVSFLHVYILLT